MSTETVEFEEHLEDEQTEKHKLCIVYQHNKSLHWTFAIINHV